VAAQAARRGGQRSAARDGAHVRRAADGVCRAAGRGSRCGCSSASASPRRSRRCPTRRPRPGVGTIDLAVPKLREGSCYPGHSTHRSVRELVASIRTWITNWSDDPKPFVWHRPPTRSSTASRHIVSGLLTRDTRSLSASTGRSLGYGRAVGDRIRLARVAGFPPFRVVRFRWRAVVYGCAAGSPRASASRSSRSSTSLIAAAKASRAPSRHSATSGWCSCMASRRDPIQPRWNISS
jgi:hypothetical protein